MVSPTPSRSLWWVLGPVLALALGAALIWLFSQGRPIVPPGLVEKRGAVAKLLEEASRIEDVDIRPLEELEAKKDYRGARALMEQALAVNAQHEALNASLLTLSQELTRLAVGVEPDEVGAKAVEAFGFLAKLARAEQKFFVDRRRLYELTRDYYAEIGAKKSPSIPPGLGELADAVNADLEKAKTLHRDFAASIRSFDEAVAGR